MSQFPGRLKGAEMDVERIIQDHKDIVHTVAARFSELAGDPDLLQCGMIGLWQAAERWDGVRPFRPLARACVRNAMMDHMRRLQRWEPPTDAQPQESGEDGSDVWREICAKFPRGSVERILLLGLAEGRSKREMAQKLRLSRRAVDRIAKEAWDKLAPGG